MLNYEHTTYYTLAEVIGYMVTSGDFPPTASLPLSFENGLTIYLDEQTSQFYEDLPFLTISGGHVTGFDSYVAPLIEAIERKYNDHIAVITRGAGDEIDPLIEETAFGNAVKSFVMSLLSVIKCTYPRYSTVLQAYAAQQSALLSKVKVESESLSRFNDAPQNSGDYAGDTYASNYQYVKGEQEIDHGTPIERLHQIEISYNNVIKDWLNEFAPMFLLEVNL